MPGAQDGARVSAEHMSPPMLPDGQGGVRRPVLLLGTTIAFTAVRFVLEQAEYYSSLGWDVHIVCAPTQGIETLRQSDAITVHEVPMSREPSPMRDVISLFQWIKVLRSIDPDIVMSGTPKAGLLGMAASWITRVPARVYLLRGLRAEGLTGVRRSVSLRLERLACRMSTEVVSVSASLMERYISLGLTDSQSIRVLGHGSSNGVDTDHFHPPTRQEQRLAKHRWGFADSDVVIGYVGRLSEDKGILDLVAAYELVAGNGQLKIMLVGPDDSHGVFSNRLVRSAGVEDNFLFVDALFDPREALWAMDILAHPSIREGFPNVVLEAAACGLPVVTTCATGCIDSIVPGDTGLIYEPHEVGQLAQQLTLLIEDGETRKQLGSAARSHVMRNFDHSRVWQEMANYLSGCVRTHSESALPR